MDGTCRKVTGVSTRQRQLTFPRFSNDEHSAACGARSFRSRRGFLCETAVGHIKLSWRTSRENRRSDLAMLFGEEGRFAFRPDCGSPPCCAADS